MEIFLLILRRRSMVLAVAEQVGDAVPLISVSVLSVLARVKKRIFAGVHGM